MQAQLTRRLEGLEVVALFVDGVVVAQQTVIVALGITQAGHKEPLGRRLGSTENAVVGRGQRTHYERAFCTEVGSDAPIALDTVVWIASMTRAITATAAM